MKKKILGLVIGFMLIGANLFAADGDLIVNGNVGIGTTNPTEKLVVNGNVTVSGNLTALNVLAKYYQSPEQTITAAGALTLAHGLGVEPVLIQVVLICKTADAGYSVGDKLFVNPNLTRTSTYGQGVAVVPDATNLNIRFGNQAIYGTFTGLNKTTGAPIALANTKWNVIFRAWAF